MGPSAPTSKAVVLPPGTPVDLSPVCPAPPSEDLNKPAQRPFFEFFSARFSIMVFAGFFFVVFFCCMPFAIINLL